MTPKDLMVIDEEIHDKVMGWMDVLDCNGLFVKPPREKIETARRLRILPHIPAYTTDIALAWKVVERMRGREYLFKMKSNSHLTEAFFESSENIFSEFHETDTVAICKAALKAVEGEG